MTQPLPSEDDLQPVLRGPVEDDWAFIRDSWKKSYRDSERHVPAHIYWPNISNEVDNYIRHAQFRIACDPEDSDFIWGWSCIEGGLLHYVFIRNSSRGQGVARMLVHGLPRPLACTHWSEAAEGIAKKYPGELVYQPSRRRR